MTEKSKIGKKAKGWGAVLAATLAFFGVQPKAQAAIGSPMRSGRSAPTTAVTTTTQPAQVIETAPSVPSATWTCQPERTPARRNYTLPGREGKLHGRKTYTGRAPTVRRAPGSQEHFVGGGHTDHRRMPGVGRGKSHGRSGGMPFLKEKSRGHGRMKTPSRFFHGPSFKDHGRRSQRNMRPRGHGGHGPGF